MVSAIIRIFVVVIIFVSFAYQSEAQQITAVDVKYEVTESNLEISFRLNGNSSAKPCSHGSLEIYAEVTTLDGKKIFRDPRKSCLVMMHTLNSTSQHKLTIPWKHWFYTGGNFTGILTLNAWCDDDKVLYSTALRDTVNFQVPKHQIDKYCNTYRYFFYDQELTMTEFTTENTSIGLKLTGKIVAKFPKDSILFMDEGYDYYIVPVISKGEKVLYNGNLNYSSSASLTFYDQKPRWFSLVIPYKELDLINDLQYDITFYYRAKETYKPKKPIGSFSYFPALPAPVSISDLNVTATNFRVNPDTMVDGVEGMLFTAKAHFSHPSSIVRPSEECKSIGVKFSVQLSGKAGETKFVLPQTSEHNRTSYYTYTPVNSFLTYHPDTAKDIELFVPFCKILQPPVRLDMKAELTAELSDGCKVLPVLASKDFYFTHPGIRRYKFEVQSLGVVVKEYDVAGKNIPIIGAFIGGRKGRGRGAPELAWVVDHGNDVEYRSQVARNSYTGFGGKTNFFTCPNDRITLSILDIDYFLNPTDNIEYIKLPKAIPYMMNLSVDTAIGDVSDLKYKISAYMPEFPASNSLNVMTYKATYKGVSGIVVAADKGITLTDCVGIPFEPILFNNSIPYNPSESYYVNTEVDKSLMFSGTPSVFPNNFFVPYYSIRSGSSCGITVKCGETPIFTRLSSENIVVPPIRDAKPSVVHFRESKHLYNTITGQEIEFKYNIPELLADRSFDVIAEYYIDGKRYDSLNITKETILYTDRYMYFNGQDLYFMPYRDFYDYSNKKASVSLRIRIRAGVERIITGDSTFVFRFDVPQVYSVFPVRKSGAMENSNLQCMIKVGRAMEFISFSNPGESIAGVAAGTLKPIFCAASDEVHIEITGQTAEGEEVFVKTTVAVKKLLKKKGKVQLKDGKQKFTLWLEVNK